MGEVGGWGQIQRLCWARPEGFARAIKVHFQGLKLEILPDRPLPFSEPMLKIAGSCIIVQ